MTNQTANHSTPQARTRAIALLLITATGATTGGCYERVVSSKGMGAQQAEGGYRSDTYLDRAYDDLTGANDKPKAGRPKVGAFRAR